MVECIGISVATFGWDLLQRRRRGVLPNGVFYPEELYKEAEKKRKFEAKVDPKAPPAKLGASKLPVPSSKPLQPSKLQNFKDSVAASGAAASKKPKMAPPTAAPRTRVTGPRPVAHVGAPLFIPAEGRPEACRDTDR